MSNDIQRIENKDIALDIIDEAAEKKSYDISIITSNGESHKLESGQKFKCINSSADTFVFLTVTQPFLRTPPGEMIAVFVNEHYTTFNIRLRTMLDFFRSGNFYLVTR